MTTGSTPGALAEGPPITDVPRLRRGFLPVHAFANLTVWTLFFTAIVFTVQLRLRQLAPEDKAGVLSTVLLVSSILTLITNSPSGRLSDRTTSRWGMRRPWLAGGAVVGFAALLIMAVSPTVPVLVIGSCFGQVGFAICVTVLLSLLPEQMPSARQGRSAPCWGWARRWRSPSGWSSAAAPAGTHRAVQRPGRHRSRAAGCPLGRLRR